MAKIKKAQSGYSTTAKRVDSLRSVGAKQLGTPAIGPTLKRLKAAEAQEKKEDAMKTSKKKYKMGGTVKKAQAGHKAPKKNPQFEMALEKSKADTIKLNPPAPRKGGKLIMPKVYKTGGKMSKMSKKK